MTFEHGIPRILLVRGFYNENRVKVGEYIRSPQSLVHMRLILREYYVSSRERRKKKSNGATE